MAKSMMDELEALEGRVRQRLSELQPLVDEFRELEQVAQRLGMSSESAAPAGAKPSPAAMPARSAVAGRRPRARRRPSPARAAGATTASRTQPARAVEAAPRAKRAARARRPSAHGDQLLALVKQRPGITVREIGEQMGVDPTSLYRVVRRLEQTRQIKKEGRELRPL